MMYGGIDLHSNNSVIAITDCTDRVVAQKRLPNEISKIIGFLARWRDEMAGVVVESTYNWYWLVDGLQDAGFQVHLANAHCGCRWRRRITPWAPIRPWAERLWASAHACRYRMIGTPGTSWFRKSKSPTFPVNTLAPISRA